MRPRHRAQVSRRRWHRWPRRVATLFGTLRRSRFPGYRCVIEAGTLTPRGTLTRGRSETARRRRESSARRGLEVAHHDVGLEGRPTPRRPPCLKCLDAELLGELDAAADVAAAAHGDETLDVGLLLEVVAVRVVVAARRAHAAVVPRRRDHDIEEEPEVAEAGRACARKSISSRSHFSATAAVGGGRPHLSRRRPQM